MTQLGLDIWAVQLLGRWGSSSVQKYVRDSSVGLSAALARRHLLASTLASFSRDAAAADHDADFDEKVKQCVQKALGSLAPHLASRLTEPLLESLRAELARSPPTAPRAASTSSSSSSSSAEEGADEDENTEAPKPPAVAAEISSCFSAKRHRILIGPADTIDREQWLCLCGWRFGPQGGPRDGARDCRDTDTLCRRCFPPDPNLAEHAKQASLPRGSG